MPTPTSLTSDRRRRTGFSITELLVVIAIIALLVGVLLVALSGVRNKALGTQTLATIRGFSQACDSFQLEQGFYPGVVPEAFLANDPKISGTENALLHLMGGYRLPDQAGYASLPAEWVEITFANPSGGPDFAMKVNPREIGNGPVINGKQFGSYFSPAESGREFAVAAGQIGVGGAEPEIELPDLLDAWGQPIVYLRQARTVGPLVGDLGDSPAPQFYFGCLRPYCDSSALGELGANQVYDATDNPSGSLFSGCEPNRVLAQMLRTPAIGQLDFSAGPLNGAARGSYIVISAGRDGVYLGARETPDPAGDLCELLTDPRVLGEFDDVISYGGG